MDFIFFSCLWCSCSDFGIAQFNQENNNCYNATFFSNHSSLEKKNQLTNTEYTLFFYFNLTTILSSVLLLFHSNHFATLNYCNHKSTANRHNSRAGSTGGRWGGEVSSYIYSKWIRSNALPSSKSLFAKYCISRIVLSCI